MITRLVSVPLARLDHSKSITRNGNAFRRRFVAVLTLETERVVPIRDLKIEFDQDSFIDTIDALR